MKHYHNTTGRVDASAMNAKCIRQEERIWLWIRRKGAKCWTSEFIWHELLMDGTIPPRTPLTSVRRAMNNLKNEGMIKDSGYRGPSTYGEQQIIWILKK